MAAAQITSESVAAVVVVAPSDYYSSCHRLLRSLRLNTHVRKFNVYTTLALVLIGIMANSLGVFVFVQRRYRKQHSSFILLLFLCLCDGLFLLVHFFEDTLRTLADVHDPTHNRELVSAACSSYQSQSVTSLLDNYQEYKLDNLHDDSSSSVLVRQFVTSLNIVDSYEITCQWVNFMRYFLRFLSAYIIVAFTLQRSFAIRFPLQSHTLESARIVKYITLSLVLVAFSLNIWTPSYFHLNPTNNTTTTSSSITYCDIQKTLGLTYFYFTCCYVVVVVLIPILIILVSNCYIIRHVVKSQKKRGLIIVNTTRSSSRFNNNNTHNNNNNTECNTRNFLLVSQDSEELSSSLNISTATGAGDRLMMRVLNRSSNSNRSLSSSPTRAVATAHNQTLDSAAGRITRMLLLMSFSYALLNLPYLIAWCVFIYQMVLGDKSGDEPLRHDLNSALQLCEVLYVANYAGHFFIYCLSGKRFRHMLAKSLEFKSFGPRCFHN